MGQCRLLSMQDDTNLLRKNLHDASLIIVAIIKTSVYPYTRHD